MTKKPVELTLIGKPECRLCVDAAEVIKRVLEAAAEKDIALSYTELNILDDPELAAKYGDEIPVVLVNGSAYASFKVHEDKLAYAILHERDKMAAKSRRRWWRRDK